MRELSGLFQREVNEMLGVKQTTVSMWEIGENVPRVELLPKIAGLYNCSIDELLGSLNSEHKLIKIEGNCDVECS
jgi:transcriptional regulator with XRE-family HTH domain